MRKRDINILLNLEVEMIFTQCIVEIIIQNQREVSCINLFGIAFTELRFTLRYVKLNFMKPNKL
jgi:hypothetical protein